MNTRWWIRTAFIAIVVALCAAAIANHGLWASISNEPLVGSDIYNVWEEGKRVAEGLSPYSRIVGQSLRENHNYPTYLPFSYLFVALLDHLGIKGFEAFMQAWRPINLACHLGLGLLTLQVYLRQGRPVAGLLALTLLLLGRWSSFIVEVQQLEFASVLTLVAAGLTLRRRPMLSAVLLGLSLSIKHLGILVMPCFLIELQAQAQTSRGSAAMGVLKYSLIALALPALVSLPFVLLSGNGFALNMLFSLSREAADHGAATGSRLLLASAEGSRLLLLGLLLLNLLAQHRERISFWLASTLALLIFVQFNPVVFGQYFIWLMSLGLIAAATTTTPNGSGDSRA
jgi:uncharacterized membrane protein